MYLCVLSRVAPLHVLRSNHVTVHKWGWVWTRYSCLKTYSEKISITVWVPAWYPGNTNVMPTSHIQVLETTVINGISAGHPLPFFCLGTGVCSVHLRYIQLVTIPCMYVFLLQAAHKIALCHPKFIHLWSRCSQAMVIRSS